jgi:hypothetical protein
VGGFLQGDSPAGLEPVSESRFVVPHLWRIDFVDGSDLVWTSESDVMGSDHPVRFRRVPASAPTTEKLRDFAGMYCSPELDRPYFLVDTLFDGGYKEQTPQINRSKPEGSARSTAATQTAIAV